MTFRTLTTPLLLLLLLFCVSAAPLASVSVAPLAVYIDSRTRSSALTLFNPGDRTEEIRIDFGFGYPQNDDRGEIVVPVTDVAPAGEPAATPWLSAFPQRMRLEPGQTQVVRIIARPPADLPDGEYWARALIHSEGGQTPIEARQNDVSLRIDVNTVMVIAVNYRNGVVDTGLRVDDARATLAADSLVHELELARTGNAAWLGRVVAEVLDPTGKVLERFEDPLPVYRSLYRRIALQAPAAPASTVRYTFDTHRDDLPEEGPLPAEPFVYEIPVR